MANAEVLLLQPVEHLGHEGEQVKVKAGYARNFLLPRKLAVPLTRANKKQVEALGKAREARLSKEREGAEQTATKLGQLHVAIPVKTGPGGKLFGAVTAIDIHNRLAEEQIELDRKQIHLSENVKTLGKHTAQIKLHSEITVDFEFEVVSENPIEESESE